MTRQDLKGKTYDEMQSMLEAELVKFSEEISDKELTEEDLLKKEQDVIKELNDYDNYLNKVEYELPKEHVFGDENNREKYTRNDIAKKIIYFFSKMEVEFQYTLGMYQLVNLWKGNIEKINYKAYDSTLRCLGGLKFKGYNEWKDILAVHDYLSECHEAYKMDLAWYLYLSTKHNAIMDIMKKPEPAPEVPAEA